MVDVRRNDHSAGSYFGAYQFGSELLFKRDVFHLFRDHATAGVVHLREVLIAISGGICASFAQPFCARLWHFVRRLLNILCIHLVPLVLNENYTHRKRRTRRSRKRKTEVTKNPSAFFVTFEVSFVTFVF